MIVIVHRIYEGDSPLPVVEHRFFGQTLAEAERVYRAHQKTDAFLRSCDMQRRFGNISCRTRRYVTETA